MWATFPQLPGGRRPCVGGYDKKRRFCLGSKRTKRRIAGFLWAWVFCRIAGQRRDLPAGDQRDTPKRQAADITSLSFPPHRGPNSKKRDESAGQDRCLYGRQGPAWSCCTADPSRLGRVGQRGGDEFDFMYRIVCSLHFASAVATSHGPCHAHKIMCIFSHCHNIQAPCSMYSSSRYSQASAQDLHELSTDCRFWCIHKHEGKILIYTFSSALNLHKSRRKPPSCLYAVKKFSQYIPIILMKKKQCEVL